MTDVVNVTITAPDADWLRAMTRKLIEQGLAAAGNIAENVTSVYRWEGEVHEVSEAVASLRTQRRHVPAIVELVQSEHPYEVPHVVAVPVDAANERYVQWIVESTGGPGE